MPRKPTPIVPYTDETVIKVRVIRPFIGLWAKIVERVQYLETVTQVRQPAEIILANCGPGIQGEDDDRHASADVTLITEVFASRVKARFHLIDAYQPNIESIKAQLIGLTDQAAVEFYCGDNVELVPEIIRAFDHPALGLIFSDPNGPDNIKDLATAVNDIEFAQRIDWLIHISATGVKRPLNCNSCPEWVENFKEVLDLTGKKRGLIKQSPFTDSDQWHFAFMTNFNGLSQWAARGWFDMHSPQGQEILQKANLSRRQQRNHKQMEFSDWRNGGSKKTKN